MFAVCDSRTGKFLISFSGSLNSFGFHTHWKLEKELGRKPTRDEVHAEMFCLDTANGAKVYKTKQAVASSFYSYRYRRNAAGRLSRIPLEEALPWLQILPVKFVLVCDN